MTRPAPTEHLLLPGPVGAIDVLIDTPNGPPRGVAIIAHPHPLYGGANTNKVAHTLARTLRDAGFVAVRPNFRGVGGSEGVHDHGHGETEDLLAVVAWAHTRWGEHLPVVLGGFSFGGYVQCRIAARLHAAGTPAQFVALVGMAAGTAADGTREYATPALPAGQAALLVHGENDDTVALANVLDWARPQERPVIVIPGADHFFHGKLHLIRDVLAQRLALL